MSSSGVFTYHERTKHRPERYARGPATLDWDTQPYPFRRYRSVEQVELPLLKEDPGAGYLELYSPQWSHPAPFTTASMAALLELSMGLSAWKGYEGSRWALRMNPSSGNLHPTEAYPVILPATGPAEPGAPAPGVYHYAPDAHLLERRAPLDNIPGADSGKGLTGQGMLLALTAIPWREAWKYGERAFRYCCLDAGHAMAAIRFSASLLGWKVRLVEGVGDDGIARLLGFDKTTFHPLEPEHPECLLHIYPGNGTPSVDLPGLITALAAAGFAGEPNTLSPEHVEWEAIGSAMEHTAKAGAGGPTPSPAPPEPAGPPVIRQPSGQKAAGIIRSRRSGQAYDGMSGIEREGFFAMLDKTVPRPGCGPFDLGLPGTNVHLAIFVHRVMGLERGLYMLVREKGALGGLKEAFAPGFAWSPVPDAPDGMELYLLKEGDLRAEAAFFSCRQDIAGDGAFSLGMVARFRENVEASPRSYRSLYWEAGAIGQVLYLEAEAHGLRGTGIGCFYDDTVHAMLGLTDDTFQSLYHFTVGKPIVDTRIETLPPYYHLDR